MILKGLTWLVLLQLLGNLINLVLLPALPGPIIGMLLLFGLLLLRRSIPESLERPRRFCCSTCRCCSSCPQPES